jgi:integral membrane sensor domain MASE1
MGIGRSIAPVARMISCAVISSDLPSQIIPIWPPSSSLEICQTIVEFWMSTGVA